MCVRARARCSRSYTRQLLRPFVRKRSISSPFENAVTELRLLAPWRRSRKRNTLECIAHTRCGPIANLSFVSSARLSSDRERTWAAVLFQYIFSITTHTKINKYASRTTLCTRDHCQRLGATTRDDGPAILDADLISSSCFRALHSSQNHDPSGIDRFSGAP